MREFCLINISNYEAWETLACRKAGIIAYRLRSRIQELIYYEAWKAFDWERQRLETNLCATATTITGDGHE